MNQAKVLVHQGLCMCGTLDTSSLWILVQNAKCSSLVKKMFLLFARGCVLFLYVILYMVFLLRFGSLQFMCAWCNLWSLVCWSSRGQLGYNNCLLFKEAAGQLSFSCATQICDLLVRDVDSLMLVL